MIIETITVALGISIFAMGIAGLSVKLEERGGENDGVQTEEASEEVRTKR